MMRGCEECDLFRERVNDCPEVFDRVTLLREPVVVHGAPLEGLEVQHWIATHQQLELIVSEEVQCLDQRVYVRERMVEPKR